MWCPWCGRAGTLFISIYNDQGAASRRWTIIKRSYNRAPRVLKWAVLLPALVYLWGPALFAKGLSVSRYRTYAARTRGMSRWHDAVDWVGGYPFEVAKPDEINQFFRNKGFYLTRLKTCGGGIGCNEFVFKKTTNTLSFAG